MASSFGMGVVLVLLLAFVWASHDLTAWNSNTTMNHWVSTQSSQITFACPDKMALTGFQRVYPYDPWVPRLGWTDTGGRQKDHAGKLTAQKHTLVTGGIIQTLSFYVKKGGSKLRMGIYSNNGNLPQTLLASTIQIDISDDDDNEDEWFTLNVITPVFLGPGDYWLVFHATNDKLEGSKRDVSGGRVASYSSNNLPNTFPSSPSSNNRQYSFYASLIKVSSQYYINIAPLPSEMRTWPSNDECYDINQNGCGGRHTITQLRCRGFDSLTGFGPIASISPSMTPGQSALCSNGYFLTGLRPNRIDRMQGWDTWNCQLPQPVGPAGAVYRGNTFIQSVSSSFSGWNECPSGSYMVGIKYKSGKASDCCDISDVEGLVCAYPPDVDCGVLSPSPSVTYAYSCHHQLCTASQQCKPGYKPASTLGPLTCLANGSWVGRVNCVDVDECERTCNATVVSQCNNCVSAPAGTCSNTIGGFLCSCNPGYALPGCLNVNECTSECAGDQNPLEDVCHDCPSTSNCRDTNGSFICDCASGFTGAPAASSVVNCTNVNECAVRCSGNTTSGCHNCDSNAYCNDTQGSFKCTCQPGFLGNGTACVPDDECAQRCNPPTITTNCFTCSLNSYCNKTLLAYDCPCLSGYERPANCTDPACQCVSILRCPVPTTCPINSTQCYDYPGGFACTPFISSLTFAPGAPSSTQSSPGDWVLIVVEHLSSSVVWDGKFYFGSEEFPFDFVILSSCPNNGTAFNCTMPPGAGRNLAFSLRYLIKNVSGVDVPSSYRDFRLFSYPAPTLTGGSLRAAVANAGATTLTVSVVIGQTTTVYMNGVNLSPNMAQISLMFGAANFECDVVIVNFTTIGCQLPQGATGTSLRFSVTVGRGSGAQTATGTDSLSITTDFPIITNISGCDASQGVAVVCPTHGRNLTVTVAPAVPLSNGFFLMIGGGFCENAVLQPSNLVFSCTLRPGIGVGLPVLLATPTPSPAAMLFSYVLPLMSYAEPTILNVSSTACQNETPLRLVNCIFSSGAVISIHGLNFGASGATVTIQNNRSAAMHINNGIVQNQPHLELRTFLPPPTSGIQLISVQQLNGLSTQQTVTLEYAQTSCAMGQYDVSGSCVDCMPGFHRPPLFSASACIPCPQGTAQPNFGASGCVACLPGTFSPVNASIECSNCSAGSFNDMNFATACTSCQLGRAQSATGQSACTICAEGTYSSLVGEVRCHACDAGSYARTNESHFCTLCQKGQFQDLEGKSLCNKCASGTYTNAVGRIECQPCMPGQYQDGTGKSSCHDCVSGTEQPIAGSSTCATCAPGFVSAAGSTECVGCPPGRSALGSDLCVQCPPGTHQPESNATSCLVCPAGTRSTGEGNYQCLDCPSGQYQQDSNQTHCILCGIGRFSGTPKSISCGECGIGTYQQAIGQTECPTCPDGSFANETQVLVCMSCPAGRSRSASQQAFECVDCPIGQYQNAERQTACFSCAPGTYNTIMGASVCSACPEGSYSNVEGTTQCQACAAGKFAATGGSSGCTDCPMGTFSGNDSATVCDICAGGKYAAVAISATECRECPAGKHSFSGSIQCENCYPQVSRVSGSVLCERCEEGSVPTLGGDACQCGKGYYGPRAETPGVWCKPCPLGPICDSVGLTEDRIGVSFGWWRDPTEPGLMFYRCIEAKYCVGRTADEASNGCQPHREGPLCGVCSPGFRAKGNAGTCVACPTNSYDAWLESSLVVIVVIIALICSYWFILWTSDAQRKELFRAIEEEDRKAREALKTLMEKYNTQDVSEAAGPMPDEEASRPTTVPRAPIVDPLVSQPLDKIFLKDGKYEPRSSPSVMYKVKIFVGFFQIATVLPYLGGINWPLVFVRFIDAFSWLNFDFMPWQALGCAAGMNYYQKATIVGLIPLVILAGLTIFFYGQTCIKDWDLAQQMERQQHWARVHRKLVKLVLFTVFLFYPFVSKIILGVFNCHVVGDRSFLVADFSLYCYEGDWGSYAALCGFFTALYPIGVPLACCLLIWNHRDRLKSPTTIYMIGFLYEAYSIECCYWELLDMVHKLLLTSIVTFFPTSAELPVALGVLGVYLMAILFMRPYKRKGDDRFHLLVQLVLYLIALVGLIITQLPGATAGDAVEDGLISAVLIVLTVFLMCNFLVIAGRNLVKLVRRWRLKRQKQLEQKQQPEQAPQEQQTTIELDEGKQSLS